MEIRLLGPLEVRDRDRVVTLPRRQQRALLAALALRAGEVVSTDRLIADLWGERAPASATGSLQNAVSSLRKLLGRDVLVTQAPGYRLAIERDFVDAHRFERLVAAAREAGEAERAPLLGEALALWRGPALGDLDDAGFARLEAARLDELRVAALEERVETELALGRHATLVGELEPLVAAHPLRERLRGQLMLALYRCGRQAEALEVYRAARLALADELGLDPSPDLQELERRILRQDPSLAGPAQIEVAPHAEQAARQLVTVLAAVPPSDEDPERHRALLDESLASVQDALARNGGVLERFGPEGLVAVFGADAPRDDDAQRALATAEELGLAAGIATGELVGGAGAVITRAVELARAGRLELDERTRALVSHTRRLDAPLVGREVELARLRKALGATRKSKRCQVVTVVGEPGIGKTRLARELALREGARTTVLVTRCLAQGGGATFLPLLGTLRRAGPEQALVGEEDGNLVLARLSALAGDAEAASLGEFYWAVRRLLEALGRARPVLLVLDDVHWAEPALVDLVDYLGDRADTPLLVLCLARPELERPLGDRVELGPLGNDEARTIVSGLADVDEATRDRIVELAEGNPLYAEQLASFAAEGGEGLPHTLEAVLAGRLGRLEPSERAVLQRAAVIGREFSRGAVAALVEGDVARELLALSRAGFVHPATAADPGDDGYAFHHVLLRDAAYASLTKAGRADLHERAAAWVDRDGAKDDAAAGYHLEQSVLLRRDLGEEPDALAIAASSRLAAAGVQAVRRGNNPAAVNLLERAANLLPRNVDANRAFLPDLGFALFQAGDVGRAEAALTESLRWATATGDRRSAWHARVLGSHYRMFSDPEGADLAALARELEDAVAAFGEFGDDLGLARAWGHLWSVRTWLGIAGAPLEEAGARGIEHARGAGSYSDELTAFGNLSWALLDGPTTVEDGLRRLTDLVLESSSTSALADFGFAFIAVHEAMLGRDETAARLIARSRESLADLGAKWMLGAVELMAARIAVLAGDPVRAESAARTAEEIFHAMGDEWLAAIARIGVARGLCEQFRFDEAISVVEHIERSPLLPDPEVLFALPTLRARALAYGGGIDRAERHARRAVSLLPGGGFFNFRAEAFLALAEVLSLSGQASEADEALQNALALYERKQNVACARKVRAKLSQGVGS